MPLGADALLLGACHPRAFAHLELEHRTVARRELGLLGHVPIMADPHRHRKGAIVYQP